ERRLLSVTPELLFSNGGVSSNPENFTQVGDAVFFTATSTGFGTELWVTDGTPSGTTMVADINPGPDSADPFNLVEFDGRLVFAASDGDDNFEPWISDGTESGTHRIKDINPGGSSIEFGKRYLYVPPGFPNPFPYPIELPPLEYMALTLEETQFSTIMEFGRSSLLSSFKAADTFFFGALTDNEGFELWRTDGTQEGTQLVRDMYPGNSSVHFYGPYTDIWGLTDVEGTLFYAGYDGEGDYGILKSDGSEEGTVSVTDVNPNDTTYPLRLVALNDELLFFTIDGSSLDGFNFWKSDGTEAGTALIKSFPNSSGDGIPYIRQLAVSEGLLFFAADDGANGKELWISDGTEAGTSLLADIQPGAAWSDPHDLTSVNGGIFFTANDGIH
ncbi:Bifunctional hemolysin/adenylate cyclase, partial [Durusdinium trenchii]